jgi:hypothetical protein
MRETEDVSTRIDNLEKRMNGADHGWPQWSLRSIPWILLTMSRRGGSCKAAEEGSLLSGDPFEPPTSKKKPGAAAPKGGR